MDTEV
jgi:hypothetical protein